MQENSVLRNLSVTYTLNGSFGSDVKVILKDTLPLSVILNADSKYSTKTVEFYVLLARGCLVFTLFVWSAQHNCLCRRSARVACPFKKSMFYTHHKNAVLSLIQSQLICSYPFIFSCFCWWFQILSAELNFFLHFQKEWFFVWKSETMQPMRIFLRKKVCCSRNPRFLGTTTRGRMTIGGGVWGEHFPCPLQWF